MQNCFLYVQSSTGYGWRTLFPQNIIGLFSEEPKEPSFPKKWRLCAFISFEHHGHLTWQAWEPLCSLPLGA